MTGTIEVLHTFNAILPQSNTLSTRYNHCSAYRGVHTNFGKLFGILPDTQHLYFWVPLLKAVIGKLKRRGTAPSVKSFCELKCRFASFWGQIFRQVDVGLAMFGVFKLAYV